MKYRNMWARVLVSALIAGVLPLGPGVASAGAQLRGSFRGHAYGTFANAKAGKVAATLGRSAFIPCPCNGTQGVIRSETVDSVAAGKAVKAEGIHDTVFTDKSASTAVVDTTSKVTGIRLLDGMVKAEAVEAVAHTDADPDTIRSSAGDSKFVRLSILGDRVRNSEIAAGSRMSLPGIGYLLLKNVQRDGDGLSSGSLTVDMATIVVRHRNDFDLPIGSKIVIAHAKSGYNRHEPPAVVEGSAFAASAKASAPGVENRIGRAAAIYLGCEGTKGETRRNDIDTLNVPQTLSSGTGRTTALGERIGDVTRAKTTARVQDVDLLDGVIAADVVKGEALSTFDTRTQLGTGTTEGSSFGNLKVAGVSYPVDVAPNTVVPIIGGQVTLRDELTRGDAGGGQARVVMIHVTITEGSNPYGLPAGTNIYVASARSKALPF
ncbi:hypothetical protein BH18ACT15_BH18ACT15_07100 [soil metagenome]